MVIVWCVSFAARLAKPIQKEGLNDDTEMCFPLPGLFLHVFFETLECTSSMHGYGGVQLESSCKNQTAFCLRP